jgi:hypothetical protein
VDVTGGARFGCELSGRDAIARRRSGGGREAAAAAAAVQREGNGATEPVIRHSGGW